MTAERALFWVLRLNAGVLLLALPCALLPFAWMDVVHRDAPGLGPLPDLPITRYMARSLSLVYAGRGGRGVPRPARPPRRPPVARIPRLGRRGAVHDRPGRTARGRRLAPRPRRRRRRVTDRVTPRCGPSETRP